jgi:hypothetical protein
VGLTYHRGRGRLCCHYCGLTIPPLDRCSLRRPSGRPFTAWEPSRSRSGSARSGLEAASPGWIGTPPDAVAHDALLAGMHGGETDILVGTQR